MFRPIYFSAIPSSASAAQPSYDGPRAGPSTEIQRSLPSGQELAAGQAQHSLHQGGLFENPNVSQPTYSASAFSMMAMQPTARQRKHQASQQNNYQAITRQHIQQWIDMSHIESVPITRDNFARKHLLNPLDFKNYVTVKGRLKLRGRVLLTKEENARYREIEYKDIQAWQALSQEERDHLTREGFAAKHQLSPQSFANYVSTEGQLNTRGLILCNKYQGKQYQSVNLSHVQAWYTMSRMQHQTMTLNKFALQHSLNPLNLQNYISVSGQLKARGRALLNKQQGIQYQKIDWEHIQAWQVMLSSAQGKQMTRDEFARRHQLNPSAFQKYVRANGQLRPRGQALANKEKGIFYQKVTWEDIQAWRNMPLHERKAITMGKFAEQRQLSFNTFGLYVRMNGALTQKAKCIFKDKIDALAQQAMVAPGSPIAQALTPQVSDSEDNAGDLKLFLAPGQPIDVQIITHQIDNNAPILQHHLTGETVTDQAQHLARSNISWIALRPFLNSHSQSSQRKIKSSLIEQAKEWVRTEGHHQQRFEQMLEVAINVDETLSRGTSVFAKKMIPAFTVIGPYSGTLVPDHAALEQLTKEHGHNNIQAYLYQAGPATGPNREQTISAFRTGNVLSLINDAELSEPILDRNGQVLKNNIAPIRIENKIFLVSVCDILPEQELFLDYGEAYQAHFKKQLALRQPAVSIKQETP